MYQLIISPQAKKELKKIKKSYEMAIKFAVEDIKENPDLGKQLSRNLTGKFSYRVGVYRIIYKVDKQNKVVNILSAGHRGTVYD